ncbi:MAG: Uma2 family endonuclease [Gammaproteobacteria bacterium]|nr:Uma2 family endonuclease [Gammaproteobacteria bacterium]
MTASTQMDPPRHVVSPPASSPAPPAARASDASSSPDAPVRIEVEMPRDLYDRLTDHDDAPRCRYDMTTGRAEFVTEPGVGHERRAAAISGLFSRIDDALEAAGHPSGLLVTAATRLLSDDGAFEPDASLFLDPVNAERVTGLEGWLDTRKGHPVPDLVAEIDRSVDSSHKLAPYFRMGVREAWTWSRRDGVHVWVADTAPERRFRESSRSRVLPGLRRDDLDALLAPCPPSEASRRARGLAGLVARTMLAERADG